MKNTFFRFPENMSSQARKAFRVIAVFLAPVLGIGGYLIYNALSNPSWQLGIEMIAVIILLAFNVTGLILARRDYHELAIWLIFIPWLAVLMVTSAMISGLGLVLLVSAVTIVSLIAGQTLPSRQATALIITSVVMGIITLLVDLFIPTERVAIAGFQIVIYVLLAILIPVFGYTIFRQLRDYSLRTKLIIAFILVSIIAVVTVGFTVNRIVESELTTKVEQELRIVANLSAFAIGDELDKQVDQLRAFAINEALEVELGNASAAASGNLAELERLDQQWRTADANGNDSDPLIQAVLNHPITEELHELQETFPENIEVFVTDRYGAIIAATNRTTDYYQADEEWWQAAYYDGQGGAFIGQPEFDESSQTLGFQIAVPVFSESGQIVGVLRSTLETEMLIEAMQTGRFGQTGRTEILLPNGNEVELVEQENGAFELEVEEADSEIMTIAQQGESLQNDLPILGAVSLVTREADELEDEAALGHLSWQVVTVQDRAEALQSVANTSRSIVLAGLGAILMSGILALAAAQFLTGPISRLTQAAEKVSSGDLQARTVVESHDEIGLLAGTFNVMTARLQEILAGLELRVAERTHSLELAAEVGRSVSQVRSLDVMLKDAAELIRKQFDLYYVQVYLADPNQATLRLEAGSGIVGTQLVGRGHSLPLDSNSINGRAAREKRTIVISDTAQTTTFRQNPLLPETRGEMAVPLIVADKVVGVLDMQSSTPGVLTEEILPAFEALAGQLAVAVQNANLLAENVQARAEVEKQASRLVRTSWAEHLDAIHKPEQIGFVFNHNKVAPLAEIDESQLPERGKAIEAPITITGEPLGYLMVELANESGAEQSSELVGIVARQVAQQIENLRLLENAERYRFEAERAVRLQTIEGWQEYMAARSAENLRFVYDTVEVRPQGSGHLQEASMSAVPLKVRDEMIGRLSVQGLEDADQESVELAKAVAERLSSHIESLRLFEETRSGQVELDKRARQLAAVAEVSSVSSRELEIQKMLESVVFLTQRKFGLYHAHIFTYEQQTDVLRIAACGWKEGDEHEGTHGTTTISVSQEQSLVARAARTRQSVIVNDVRNEPSWLPNPLLPDSASELAVPLIIGDKILGVLDVQSDKLDAFSEEDANIFATLASQISTALQNAQSFVQAQQQAERESRLNVISQKIQSATTVEAVLQIAARELGHTLGAPLTIAQLGLKESSNGN